MWMNIFRGSSLPAVEQSIDFAERRHALLAGNIANAGTPGYQTRDLSVEGFQQALKEAITTTRQPKATSPGLNTVNSIEGVSDSQAMQHVREQMKQILYHDGSDVGLETQVTEIAKNQSMHATAIAIMRNQFSLLQMAISGSVNV